MRNERVVGCAHGVRISLDLKPGLGGRGDAECVVLDVIADSPADTVDNHPVQKSRTCHGYQFPSNQLVAVAVIRELHQLRGCYRLLRDRRVTG